MGRFLLIVGILLLVGFVMVTGLQAGGGLKVWGQEARAYQQDGTVSGYSFGLKRLWLKEGTSVYVDFSTEIDTGALFIVLEEMPSLGELPGRPAERRISATNIGSVDFRIRKDGMYRLTIEPRGRRARAVQPVVRYKVKWGLENPDKERRSLRLSPVE